MYSKELWYAVFYIMLDMVSKASSPQIKCVRRYIERNGGASSFVVNHEKEK